MSPLQPVQLSARLVAVSSDEFRDIINWPFPDEPFYQRQVATLLRNDITKRVLFNQCTIWIYRDLAISPDIIGFGTLDISDLYSVYTNGLAHYYIPLLALKPGVKSRGYGKEIVDHLVATAALMVQNLGPNTISDRLFLDVYTANERAYKLYSEKCGFTPLNLDCPELDAQENNEPYVIMARNVAISPS